MTTHTRILLLAALLALSNLLWLAAYRSLDQAYMQESGLRDESDSLLKVCLRNAKLDAEHAMPYNTVDCDNADGDPAKCTVEGDEPLPQPAPNR
jgi:hypothetical protein